MDNPDILLLIIKNRSLYDNVNSCSVNKLFYDVVKSVIPSQFKQFYYFKRFKNRTIFPKKKKSRGTYYTLKNMYINKEETPILFF
jgi:hypothetical protein